MAAPWNMGRLELGGEEQVRRCTERGDAGSYGPEQKMIKIYKEHEEKE